jgi:T-complex protein 1 subunit theta
MKMVIILAGKLLKQVKNLVIVGLHPSEIRKCYKLASSKVLKELESTSPFLSTLPFLLVPFLLSSRTTTNADTRSQTALSTMTLPTPLTLPTLTDTLKPILTTRQFSSENILAVLIAEAALAVMPAQEKGFCVDNVGYITGFFLVCGDES